MGTRGILHIKEGRKTIVTVYRQYDCYPTGLGEDIKKALNDGNCEIVNGYTFGMNNPKHFNGAGDLAAYLVGWLKVLDGADEDNKTIGNVYLQAPNTNDVGEDYIYVLSIKDNGLINLQVNSTWPSKFCIYDGPLEHFDGKRVERMQEQKENTL